MTLGSEAARGGVAGGACACARVWTRYGTRAQSPWHCVTATLGQASAILDNRKHRLTDRALPPERTALSLVWYTWEQPWGTDHQPQELQGSCLAQCQALVFKKANYFYSITTIKKLSFTMSDGLG